MYSPWRLQGEQLSVFDETATYEINAHNARKPMKRYGNVMSELSLPCDARKRLGEYVCVADTPTGKTTRTKIITEGVWQWKEWMNHYSINDVINTTY